MRSTVLVDAGFWVALNVPRDRWHQRALAAAPLLASYQAVTTWAVVTETCYLLGKHQGTEVQSRFLDLLVGGKLVQVKDFNHQHLPVMTLAMRQYANLPMDFADASLLWLAAEEGHGRILSTDERDFGIYRWKSTHPFQNLLSQSHVPT